MPASAVFPTRILPFDEMRTFSAVCTPNIKFEGKVIAESPAAEPLTKLLVAVALPIVSLVLAPSPVSLLILN